MSQGPMLVINLERRPDRMARFSATNGFLSRLQRFPACDGRSVDRERLIAEGTIDARITCTSGALGCALSHRAVWLQALEKGDTTVFEDDAVVNGNFEAQTQRLIAQLPPVWDIIYWGWNFDVPVVVDLLPGVGPVVMHCSQSSLRQGLQQFQALDLSPRLMRLLRFCGALAYTVSARGAERLLRGCFPLMPDFYGIDLAMARLAPTMNAAVALPPLAVSPNDDSETQPERFNQFGTSDSAPRWPAPTPGQDSYERIGGEIVFRHPRRRLSSSS